MLFLVVSVKVDVSLALIAGETQILRADVLFDAGISLNPAIDLGQVRIFISFP